MVGPAFGSLLYSVGGFKLPFLAAGSFELLLTAASLILLSNPYDPKEKDNELANSMKDMGKVMGIANAKMAGRVDGKILASLIKTRLGND